MNHHVSKNRPYPLQVATEESRGIGKPKRRPQLRARWVIAEDGKLICRWQAE